MGTVLSKDEVLSRTRNNRTARLRRTAKLSELDVTEGDPDEQDADIWLVIKRLRSDYWLRGRVVARVKRTCDRCTKEYVDVSDGRFEVLLRGDVEEDNDESADAEGGFEAVEQFGRGVVEVDLKGHVRDGVYLGMETRALCEEGCVGVGQGKIQEEGKGWGRVMGEQEDVAEALMEMKRRLERQGL